MKFIVTAKEMKEYDNNTIAKIGIPALVLMERAALKLQEEIVKRVPQAECVLIVAGTGNNGADGLALARLFAEDRVKVTVCIVGDLQKSTEQFQVQYSILKHYEVELLQGEEAIRTLEWYSTTSVRVDVLVDAMFGVGLSRNVEGRYANAIRCMNNIRGYKIAADIPSGVCADSGKILGIAFRADLTVTFGFLKRGLLLYPGCELTGVWSVADIGIGQNSFGDNVPQFFCYDEPLEELLPHRPGDGNKGTFGKVLVIAGFEQMAGAAVLCAKATLETGAGMVKVVCCEENRVILQTVVPEVLYDTCENIKDSLKWADVVIIGPGLGKSAEAKLVLRKVLENAQLPLVLDADALNLISESEALQELVKKYPGGKVMTPHVGELSRLTGKSVSQLKENLLEAAESAALQYDAIMVCKDARTVVAEANGRKYLNISGNNGMATAGSGDVLAGIIAAILAQDADAFEAATVAVYLHGLAGNEARDCYTEYGVTAGRILDNIKKCIRIGKEMNHGY